MEVLDKDVFFTEKLLKPCEVAELLNISRSMSYRLLQSGKIPVVRINRVVRDRPHDLILFIKQQRMICISNRSI